jgi:fatty acid desaturase
MTPSKQIDERLNAVSWRDLVPLTRTEVIAELLLSTPWLLLSLVFACLRWYPLALLASFIFFLVGLRQTHNAFHYALGISSKGCDLVMFSLSVLMLGSMHAVQLNHLAHHTHCLSENDVEGSSARTTGWRAILVGPLFPIRLHRAALKRARGASRLWIWNELLANVLVLVAVFGLIRVSWLEYHYIAMALGQCLTSFFAVWTVHHDCRANPHQARTLRGRLKNALTFNMFFHVEHHLFPGVPTCHLPQLAERLDRVAPELRQVQVF